jgi:hydroxymethylbilane synthase
LLEPLNHEASALEVAMERAFLRRMGGGCLVPVGANASVKDGTWRLRAFVATVEGPNVMRRTTAGTLTSKAESITAVERVADEMLDAGARGVMAAYRLT